VTDHDRSRVGKAGATQPFKVGDTLATLAGTECGVWGVLTQQALFVFDLGRGTVQQIPRRGDAPTARNRRRKLHRITDVRINEDGRWRVVSDAEHSTRTYPVRSSFVTRIERLPDAEPDDGSTS